MSTSPRVSIVYDPIQHSKATTPRIIVSPLTNLTNLKNEPLLVLSKPIEIIDLTQSPLSLINSSASPHDHSYNLFANDLNSTYDIHSRRLHANWKRAQFKKKYDLLPDMHTRYFRGLTSTRNDPHYMSPRTPNVHKYYSPKQLIEPKPAKSDSPFTPENHVELRPLRGYRLQDVLHMRPITPANYYKNTSSLSSGDLN